jgi:hypothetical protein
MSDNLPTIPRGAEIDKFLERLKNPDARPSYNTARLIFALDATASREPTWDHACRITGEMFEATARIGGLEIRLAYYRGYNECRVSRWITSAAELHRVMGGVSCAGGYTQIERILDHTIRETQSNKIGALVFAGDAMEEQLDRLCHLAGELGRLGVPVFMFQEGNNPTVASAFKQIASLSGGAYAVFDLASAERLKVLLGAAAVFAAGGHQALDAYASQKGGEVLRLARGLRAGG